MANEFSGYDPRALTEMYDREFEEYKLLLINGKNLERGAGKTENAHAAYCRHPQPDPGFVAAAGRLQHARNATINQGATCCRILRGSEIAKVLPFPGSLVT